MSYFSIHNHSDIGSNAGLGFPDTICRVPDLIQRAYDLGLPGIALTDHESLSGHIQALNYYNSMGKDRSFTLGLGNEIYLVPEEWDEINKEHHNTYPYCHFILLALDNDGHKQLRELSTRAWKRSWKQRKIYRCPTYYSDLEEIIKPNQGHVIASTACLGGIISRLLLDNKWEKAFGENGELNKFINIFGRDNIYLEIQPPKDANCDQSKVNRLMWKGHEFTGIKIIPSSDSHYLKKEDAFIHKIYLNSQERDREVDEFYATTYLMSPDDLREHLCIDFTDEQIEQMFEWSVEICNRIKGYNFNHDPIIPQIPKEKIPDSFTIQHWFKEYYKNYPDFAYYALNKNNNKWEEYFFYQVEQGLKSKIVDKGKDLQLYIARLNEEFEQFRLISEQLNTSIPSYFSSMSKIIDLIWESNSLAMPARGSSAASLTNYLLEVTQIDPVPLGNYFPFWRFLSVERGTELPD